MRWMPDPTRVIWVPCVEMHTLPYTMPAVSPPYAFAVTSVRALEETLRHPALFACLQQAVWVGTFGEKTYERLCQIPGVAPHLVAASSAQDFASFLFPSSPATSGRVGDPPRSAITWILPGPVERAFSFTKFLQAHGQQVLQADLYETHSHTPTGYDPYTLLRLDKEYALCFASPSAVRGFCAWLPPVFAERQFQVYVLGESTKSACTGQFSRVEVVRPQQIAAMAKMAFS